MRVVKSVPVEEILCRGSIKDSDVAKLSSAYALQPHLSAEEADTLFLMTERCPVQAPTWSDFFIAALRDYVLSEMAPEGYVTAEKASWLKAHIVNGGRLRSTVEFRLLLDVIERARWVPLSLAMLVLEEVKGAVVHGDGPLRAGKVIVRGIILNAEVDLLRSVLCAFGGESSIALTRPEAEVLLDINAAIAGSVPPAAWTELFVKAMTSAALGAAGYAASSRRAIFKAASDAHDREAPVESQIREILGTIHTDYRRLSPEERALARLERQRIEIVTHELLDMGDSMWIAEQLTRRRRPAIEAAIYAFLRRECLYDEVPQKAVRGVGGWAA